MPDTENQIKVEFKDVCLAFGEHVVLDGVSFKVRKGEMKVVLGKSGTGKSTILRLLLGLLKPDSGEIFIDGVEISGLNESELQEFRVRMSMVFQEGALFDSLTVFENVAYRPNELHWPEEKLEQRVAEVLHFAGLDDAGDLLPGELSGGMQRMVAIARAIVDFPEVILYDEPTVGLDPPTARHMCDAAIRLRDLSDVTSLFVTHRIADIKYLSSNYAIRTDDGRTQILPEGDSVCLINTKFLVLNEGKIIFDGTDEQLYASSDPFIKSFTSEGEED